MSAVHDSKSSDRPAEGMRKVWDNVVKFFHRAESALDPGQNQAGEVIQETEGGKDIHNCVAEESSADVHRVSEDSTPRDSPAQGTRVPVPRDHTRVVGESEEGSGQDTPVQEDPTGYESDQDTSGRNLKGVYHVTGSARST